MTGPDLHTRVRPFTYRDGALVLLDQTRLPRESAYLTVRTAAETDEAIRAMRVRGAPAIGIAAAYGVAVEARGAAAAGRDVRAAAFAAIERLKGSRPTAVNLRHAMDRLRAAIASTASGGADLATEIEAAAAGYHEDDARRCAAIARAGLALFPSRCDVLTHCNTGALATGGDGTALGVVRAAHAAGRIGRVYMDETRPHLQGARLTAWELQEDRIPCTLLADAAAGFLLSRGGIGAVIVGADRIAQNGDVANKIGTYAVATLAKAHGVPFYVAAPFSTFDPALASGEGIPIEERDAREVTESFGLRTAPEGVAVWNPVFDVTPGNLVTAIVTERGVHRPPYRFGGSDAS